MLEPWFLGCSLGFNLAVLIVLVILVFFPTFKVQSRWGYVTAQILPVVIGTITVAFLEGITITLNRLTPFVLCASKDGAIAGDTVLGQYFPIISFTQAWNTRNILLLFAWLMREVGYLIQPLKAGLLNTTEDGTVIVAQWALISLIVIYSLVGFFIIAVMCWLRGNKPTGLRWDPVSIADHLMLFRHSNFLKSFEGTDIAERKSIFETLKQLRLRLGYWRRDNGEIWHGFGMVDTGYAAAGAVGNDDSPRKRRQSLASLFAKEKQVD